MTRRHDWPFVTVLLFEASRESPPNTGRAQGGELPPVLTFGILNTVPAVGTSTSGFVDVYIFVVVAGAFVAFVAIVSVVFTVVMVAVKTILSTTDFIIIVIGRVECLDAL